MQAMLNILSVIIGIVFVLLLFSLLASTVMEIVAALLSLRGKHLLYTLKNMLGDKTDAFLQHPFFQQLSYAAHRRSNISSYSLPSWITKGTFSSILTDLLSAENGNDLSEKLQAMPEGNLKQLLLFLYRQTDGTVIAFKNKIESWFDEVMERASDWYKRSMKWWLFGIGLCLAILFNADTIRIYQSLSSNASMREDLDKLAVQFVQSRDSVAGMDLNKSLDQSIPEFQELSETIKDAVQSPLGLGWTAEQTQNTFMEWMVKLLGFIITGIAVTFGAPFWFEALKKLINIRPSSANQPTTSTIVVSASQPTAVTTTSTSLLTQPSPDTAFEKFTEAAPDSDKKNAPKPKKTQ
jgi:hypothetical protein